MTSDARLPHAPRPHAPGWLRALGAGVLVLMGGTLVYAAVIAAMNLSRIGV